MTDSTISKPSVERRLVFLTKLKALVAEFNVEIWPDRDGKINIEMFPDGTPDALRDENSLIVAETDHIGHGFSSPRNGLDECFDDLMEQARKA